MYFDSFKLAILMDGHGIYIWSVYAIYTLVMVGLIIFCYREYHQAQSTVELYKYGKNSK